MRPAIERLREHFNWNYPLAHAQPYLDVAGRELEETVGLERELRFVVFRNNQVVLTERAERFRLAGAYLLANDLSPHAAYHRFAELAQRVNNDLLGSP